MKNCLLFRKGWRNPEPEATAGERAQVWKDTAKVIISPLKTRHDVSDELVADFLCNMLKGVLGMNDAFRMLITPSGTLRVNKATDVLSCFI